MGTRAVYCLIFFSLGMLCSGGVSVTEKPLNEVIDNNNNNQHHAQERYRKHFLPPPARKLIGDESNDYFTSIEGDVKATVPIINPTTPGSTASTPPPVGLSPITLPPVQPTITPPPPAGPTGTGAIGTTPTVSTAGQTWCIASPTAPEIALQVALDYACGYGGADCSPIQQGASCYNPNTLKDHASYAFNSYYQKNPVPTSCSFGGTATTTITDPSSGSCQFPSSSTMSSVPPPSTPPPSPPTDYGSTPTAPTDYGTSPPTDYGTSPPTDYGTSPPTDYGSPDVPTIDGSDEPSGSNASSTMHSLRLFRFLYLVPAIFITAIITGL